MFLKHIDLTTALRPAYLPDEVLLFLQDNVGLYEGYISETCMLRDVVLTSEQEIQAARLPEWAGIPDFASNLLCRQRETKNELHSHRSQRGGKI